MTDNTSAGNMTDITNTRKVQRVYGEIIRSLEERSLGPLEFYKCIKFDNALIDYIHPILDIYCCANHAVVRANLQDLTMETVADDIVFVIGDILWGNLKEAIGNNIFVVHSFSWDRVTYFFFPLEEEKMIICLHAKVDKSKII